MKMNEFSHYWWLWYVASFLCFCYVGFNQYRRMNNMMGRRSNPRPWDDPVAGFKRGMSGFIFGSMLAAFCFLMGTISIIWMLVKT